MATAVGTLAVRFVADTSKWNRDLRNATKPLEKLKKEAGNMAIGATAAFAGMALAVGSTVKTFAGFERGMARVGAITGASVDTMQDLETAARKMAAATEYSASQVSEGMGFMAMAGFEAKEIISALPSALTLASAGMTDIASASDIVTNVMAGMGLEADELEGAVDSLVSAMTGANVDTRGLGDAFKYVGPVAKGAGVAFNEVAASIALLGNAGIQGSMAGTTLRGAIARLLNPAAEAAKQMRKLGIEATDANGKFVGMVPIVKQIEKALRDGVVNESQLAAASLEIFGQRAGPGMLALVSQGSGALEQFITRLDESGGVAKGISDKVLKTFAGQMNITKSKIEEASISIGESLVPGLSAMNSVLAGAVDLFNEAPNAVKATTGVVAGLTTGMLGLVSQYAVLLAYGPQMIKSMKAMATIIQTRLLPTLAPVAVLLAGVAANILLAITAYGVWKRVFSGETRKAGESAGDVLKKGFTDGIADIKSALGGLMDSAGMDLGKDVADKIEDGIKRASRKSTALAAEFTPQSKSEFDSAWDEAIADWDNSNAAHLAAWEDMERKNLSEAMTGWDGMLDKALKKQAALTRERMRIEGGAQRQANGAMAPTRGLMSTSTDAGTRKLEEASQLTGEKLGSAARLFGDSIVGAMGDAGSIVKSAMSGFAAAGPFGAIAAVFADLIGRSTAFKKQTADLTNVIEEVVDAIEPIVEGAAPMAAIFHTIIRILADVLTPVFEAIKPIMLWLAEVLRAIIVVILLVFHSLGRAWNGIIGAISGFLRMLADISVFGKNPFGRLDGWADSVDRAQVSLRDLEGKINDVRNATLPDTEEATEDAADSMSNVADAARDATEEILNAPTGFKVAAARFGAISREPAYAAGGIGGVGASQSGMGSARPVNVENLNIVANDPAELARELQRLQEYDDYRITGAVGTTAPNPTGRTAG